MNHRDRIIDSARPQRMDPRRTEPPVETPQSASAAGGLDNLTAQQLLRQRGPQPPALERPVLLSQSPPMMAPSPPLRSLLRLNPTPARPEAGEAPAHVPAQTARPQPDMAADQSEQTGQARAQPGLEEAQRGGGAADAADGSVESTEARGQTGGVERGSDGATEASARAVGEGGAEARGTDAGTGDSAATSTAADTGGAPQASLEQDAVGTDGLAEWLEPPPLPRLVGTEAIRLVPPPLNAQQNERMRSQTGLTVNQHYGWVQTLLDRLANRAQQEQQVIVFHNEMMVADARRDLDAGADRIPDGISVAISRICGAYSGARASIRNAADDALATIEANATTADRQVNEAALTSRQGVENAVLASSPRIQALYEETMTPLRTLLAKTAGEFRRIAGTQSEAMRNKGREIAAQLLGEGSGAIAIAQAEQQSKAVPDLAAQGARDLVQAGEDNATGTLDQEESLGLSFMLMVNPASVRIEHVGGEDAATATSRSEQVRVRLATDYERARGFVEQTRERALRALESGERSAVKQMHRLERQLTTMARQRRDRLCNAILQGAAPAADAWAQLMTRANQLIPPDKLIDSRRLEPRLLDMMESMNALAAKQRADVDAQSRSGLENTLRSLQEDRATIDEATNAALAGVRETEQQAGAVRQIGDNFAAGFRGVAEPASSAAGEFRTQVEEKLGQPVEAVREGMRRLLAEITGSLSQSTINFNTTLGQQVTNLRANLAPALDQVAQAVLAGTQQSLQERANRLYAAMDRVGTDESAVLGALRGLTVKLGLALEEYWQRQHPSHSLRWWLDDELSYDDKQAAIHYLDGDPLGGARYELAASLHWYGDDAEQIEAALRALSPEDLQRFTTNPAAEQVIQQVQNSLTGTNLDVTNALLSGRIARADALRLIQKVDAARMNQNDDALHDALSNTLSNANPSYLTEVRREAADILAGNRMTPDRPSIADQDATEALTTYVIRPVQVYDPASETERTVTLSEPSRALAVALVSHGEGSPEARAARLAFEASRDDEPRIDRLAIALNDPDLIRARRNPLLTEPNQNPRAAARAQAELDRLEQRRADMLRQFAKLRGADEATRNDPARARAYTEQAVADMFGSDDLGRELGSSMVRDARANPAVAIKFAVRGAGTNEELLRQTLRGMTPAEIADLRRDYAARFGNGNLNALYDDLGVFQNEGTAQAAGVEHATGGGFFTELSGDERQEIEELLLGVPQNDRDRWRLARLRAEHQMGEGTTAAGRGLGLAESEPARALRMDRARMEQMIADAGGPDRAFDERGNFVNRPELGLSANDFRIHVAGTSGAAGDYKHHVDSIADMITGAIAIIGAVVGTIVVTVLTLGTATPLIVGLWAAGIAAATGAASMAANYAIKGSRYGWEQAAVDSALTLLDAATAGLMAGAGAKAARAADQIRRLNAMARTPAQAAVASRLAQRAAQKELVRGFVRASAGGGISGMARTALTDGTWDQGILHGVGSVVAGGVKAATISAATHGASTGFSRTIGKSLAQSTSFLGRGLGSGLSGAVGSAAGRTTEVGIDALSGKKQGPWDEVLGSIASAGGRGFVENFAQGVAEVPKARRDAAQARMDLERAQTDAKRVARYGPSAEDYAGDAQFRRKAAAVALHEDRRTDLRRFLADLDAGVTGDRAAQETQHRLTRAFRREALAGIPPEQRGTFAEVPIHILPDADFARFTGSASGRAVTIFVDGEPQIIARRSAAPEDIREEGIHVLQSRDPRWKNRIGRLDETNLARWRELDLESQLSLYRDKLEIEIDAQERLRRGLNEEADTSDDPVRRASLRARAEETTGTEQALRARRDEVDALGPRERAAIQSGDSDFPQYLREEPRLFNKKQKTLDVSLPDELAGVRRDEPRAQDPGDAAISRRGSTAIEGTSLELEGSGRRPPQLGDLQTEDDMPARSRLETEKVAAETVTDLTKPAPLRTEPIEVDDPVRGLVRSQRELDDISSKRDSLQAQKDQLARSREQAQAELSDLLSRIGQARKDRQFLAKLDLDEQVDIEQLRKYLAQTPRLIDGKLTHIHLLFETFEFRLKLETEGLRRLNNEIEKADTQVFEAQKRVKYFQNRISTEVSPFHDVRLSPLLGEPRAGWDYSPSRLEGGTEANALSHLNGYRAELRLANHIVAELNEIVIKYGDRIGRHGSDVISVNPTTGEVTLWDSKYRGGGGIAEPSPTFTGDPLRNAIDEAIVEVQNSPNLSKKLKQRALEQLRRGDFKVVTASSDETDIITKEGSLFRSGGRLK